MNIEQKRPITISADTVDEKVIKPANESRESMMAAIAKAHAIHDVFPGVPVKVKPEIK